MNDSADFPAAIRARVHDGAIDRVTRFFAATLAEAFAELIQNARRGGARGLAVVTEAIPAGGIRVTVTDDGRGIADPAVLLSFGESGWNEQIAEREDPAGIGVYALSKRGCSVSSQPHATSGEHAPGWRAELTPDHFLGKEDAAVLADDAAPWPHGTAISFMADETLEAIHSALSGAARHCLLPATFNGEDVERKASSTALSMPSTGAASPSASSGTASPASTRLTSTSTVSRWPCACPPSAPSRAAPGRCAPTSIHVPTLSWSCPPERRRGNLVPE